MGNTHAGGTENGKSIGGGDWNVRPGISWLVSLRFYATLGGVSQPLDKAREGRGIDRCNKYSKIQRRVWYSIIEYSIVWHCVASNGFSLQPPVDRAARDI